MNLHAPIASLILIATATHATAQPAPENPDPVLEDYASTYETSYQEAAARYARIAEISRIDKELLAKFPNQFGGLYIEHKPSFRVIVKMTGAGGGLLKQITSDPLYVVEKAEVPIQQLT
jgi:hypothetical protein